MTTLIHQASSVTGLSVYDRIQDPLAFIEQMGKVFWQAKACGCQTEAEGKLLALACMSERMNPFDINKTYHLMDGKLSMRADAMLANFRQLGGKYKWIKSGDDGKSASIELTYDGNTITSTYTIEQAHQAGLVKDRSNWVKDPASMLQARAISRGIRMIAPEVIAGVYTPEEIGDFGNESTPAATTKQSRTARKEKAQSEDVIDSEIVDSQSASASSDGPAESSSSNDSNSTAEEPPFEADAAKSEAPPAKKEDSSASEIGTSETAPATDRTALLMDIAFAAQEAGLGATTEEATKAIEAKLGKRLEDIDKDKLKNLLTNLQNAIAKAKSSGK